MPEKQGKEQRKDAAHKSKNHKNENLMGPP